LPNNVPTPAAAAGPSAGIITVAASAPIDPLDKKTSVAGCKKARIRVEDMGGKAKGWISVHHGPFSKEVTTLPGHALHVKAEKTNSGPTTLWILNVTDWSRLCIVWSTNNFDAKDGNQYGKLKPCDKAGTPIKVELDVIRGQCLPEVWDIDNEGVITPTWRQTGGSGRVPLRMAGSTWFQITSTQLPLVPRMDAVKFVYEPIE
ncbi:hypothetical protein M407DRAFT_200056, partial [Tulasnella calospora MUT 4182]